jgi:hypothetical protein
MHQCSNLNKLEKCQIVTLTVSPETVCKDNNFVSIFGILSPDESKNVIWIFVRVTVT